MTTRTATLCWSALIAFDVAIWLALGAWAIVAILAFGTLLFASALGGLRWDGAP